MTDPDEFLRRHRAMMEKTDKLRRLNTVAIILMCAMGAVVVCGSCILLMAVAFGVLP